jgi:hypothetical protein
MFTIGQKFILNQDIELFILGEWLTAKKGTQIEIYEIEDDAEPNIKVMFLDIENWYRMSENEIKEIIKE